MVKIYSWGFVFFGLSIFSQAQSPVTITGIAPAVNSYIPTEQELNITFDRAIEGSTVNDNTVRVFGRYTGSYGASDRSNIRLTDKNVIGFTPYQGFKPNEPIQLSVTAAIKDVSGLPIGNPLVYQYRTQANDKGKGVFVDSLRIGSKTAGLGSLFQLGDMNNDTHLDIVEYDSQGLITVYKSEYGSFTVWSNTNVVAKPLFMHLADMAGDGFPDVIVVKDPDKKVYVYPNIQGTLSETAIEISLSTRPLTGYQDDYIPISGDIDADGDLDLVFGNGDVISVVVNSKEGQSYLVKTIPVTNGSGTAPVFMDVDNDGDLDIVTQAGAICKNDGKGNFAAFTNTAITIISSEEFDFDNDGDLDLAKLVTGSKSIQVQLWKNDLSKAGFILFKTIDVATLNATVTSLYSGDFNGDGSLDLGLTSLEAPYANSFLFLFNDGKGSLLNPVKQNVGRQNNFSATADMDNDGDLDFVGLVNEAGIDEKHFMVYYNGKPCLSPYIVNSTEDSEVPECGMLRYAVNAANDNMEVVDIITFDLPSSKTQTIHLQYSLYLREAIYVKGPGKELLSIQNENGNIFSFQPTLIPPSGSARLAAIEASTFENLTFENSQQALYFDGGDLTVKNCQFNHNNTGTFNAGGGAIYFNATNLTVDSCVFNTNRADYSSQTGVGFNGAAIYCNSLQGKVLVSNSTFDGNYGQTDSDPTYSAMGHGLFLTGSGYTAEISRSTFSNNIANAGAAIANSSLPSNFVETVNISNSTFSGNISKTSGGAINISHGNWNFDNVTITQNGVDSIGSGRSVVYPTAAGIFVDNANVTFTNTILAGNFNMKKEDLHITNAAKATTKGGNLFGGFTDELGAFKPSSATLDLYEAKSSVNPLLAPLSNNGGPTLTHLPYPNSPVIDFGVTTSVSTDQRGSKRMLGSKVDAGAVEAEACKDFFLVTRREDSLICGSLRLAVYMANATKGANIITFDKSLKNDSIVLKSRLTITEGLTIHGVDSVAISTTGSENIFNIQTADPVSMDHLILRNSKDRVYSAVHYLADSGSFTLKNVTIAKNTSVTSIPAGLYSKAHILTIDSCRFISNLSTSSSTQTPSNGGAMATAIATGHTTKISIRYTDFRDNSLNSSFGGNGGAAYIVTSDVKSSIKIENSSFSRNTARQAGGLYLSTKNEATITNSTFSGNVSNTIAGGIFLTAGAGATFTNVTISNNTAKDAISSYPGGGIYFNSGKLNLHNTLIADNIASKTGKDIGKTSDTFAKVVSLGNNLIGDSTDGSDRTATDGNKWLASDFLGTSAKPIAAKLLSLTYNGGITLTQLPQPTSPVVNKGDASVNLPLDQRGKPRVGAYDIGAIEVQDGIPPDAFAGNDTSICGSSLRLKANLPLTGETGKWTSKTSQVVFANSALFNTTVSNLPSGDTVKLYWTVSKGALFTTDSVLVNNRLYTEAISAGKDTVVIKSPFTLLATPILRAANYTWFDSQHSSLATARTVTVPLKLDTNVFYLDVTLNGCTKKDTIKVLYLPQSDTANAGADRNICADSVFLQAIRPVAGAKGKWTYVNPKLVSVDNDTLYNTKVRKIPVQGKQGFIWTVTKGQVITRDTVYITRIRVPFGLIVGKILPTCSASNGSITLTLTGTQFTYEVKGDLTNTYTTNLAVGAYHAQAVSKGTDCAIDTTIQLVSHNPYTMKLNPDSVKLCQGDSVSLTATLTRNGQTIDTTATVYNWEKNGSFLTEKSKTVKVAESGNYSLLMNFGTGCQLRDTVKVTVLPKPSFTMKDSLPSCKDSVLLQAPALQANQTGLWSVAPNSGLVIKRPTSNSTTVYNLKPFDTDNPITWTVTNTATRCSTAHVSHVYYANTILTKQDDKAGLAGYPIVIVASSNDTIAPGDSSRGLNTLKLFGNQNKAILGWTIEGNVITFETNRKLANTQILTYTLENSCGYTSRTGNIIVTTLNPPPNRLDTIIVNADAATEYTFTIPVKRVDANNYLDTVYTTSTKNGVLVSAKFNKDTTEIIITLNYSSQARMAEFEEVAVTVCDDTLDVRRCNTIYITVPVQTISKPIVYNGLSPNSDGKHDVLEIEYIGQYPNNRLKIFNRWGDKVYDEKDYDGVKVAFDGKSLPDGTYYYVLELGNGSKPMEGFIVLKR